MVRWHLYLYPMSGEVFNILALIIMSVVVFIFLKQYITYIYQTQTLIPVSLSAPSRGTESLDRPQRERESLPHAPCPPVPPARPTESALHDTESEGSVVVFNRYHLLDWDYLLFPVCWKLLSEKDAEIFQIFSNRFTYSPRFSMLMWQIMLIGFWS